MKKQYMLCYNREVKQNQIYNANVAQTVMKVMILTYYNGFNDSKGYGVRSF